MTADISFQKLELLLGEPGALVLDRSSFLLQLVGRVPSRLELLGQLDLKLGLGQLEGSQPPLRISLFDLIRQIAQALAVVLQRTAGLDVPTLVGLNMAVDDRRLSYGGRDVVENAIHQRFG